MTLTCIKEMRQQRNVFSTSRTIDLQPRDEIEIIPASNLPNSDGYYWVLSINDDGKYGDDSYGYLIYIDEEDFQNYFE